MKKTGFRIIPVLLIFFLQACSDQSVNVPLKIAISKAIPTGDYNNYIQWLKKTDSTLVCLDMYHLSVDSALIILQECDGLLLTGGTDIYPGRFGKVFDTALCWEADLKRDSIEIALFAKACSLNMPVLGICRGLQLINVASGGSLTIDIPTYIKGNIMHQCPDIHQCFHDVSIVPGSLLFEITGIAKGTVNSNHHQCIDSTAPGFKSAAATADGVSESIELEIYEQHNFLLGVQWHPERLDYENPLSGKIATRFISEAKNYSGEKKYN